MCGLRPTSDSAKASKRQAVSCDVLADMLRCPFAFGPPPIAPRYPGAGAPPTTSVGCAAMGEGRADGWYQELDGTGLAAAIRDGDVSAVEAVDAAIDRIESVDPLVHALVAERFDAARDEAARPLG